MKPVSGCFSGPAGFRLVVRVSLKFAFRLLFSGGQSPLIKPEVPELYRSDYEFSGTKPKKLLIYGGNRGRGRKISKVGSIKYTQ